MEILYSIRRNVYSIEKRGYNVEFIGFFTNNQLQVSALLFSAKMAGGLYLEINSGPVVTNYEFLPKCYEELKIYARKLKAMELVVKPYDIYQVFNSKGESISTEKKELVSMLTNLNYQFDGLQKDYPGGEGDWHFVKDLNDLTEETLLKSFTKQRKSLVKKLKHLV
ncbi:FemAB domain protein [Streptococcus sp. CM7]|nr:FemAB domain protein [Streptococcus sp. CM7]